MRMTVVLMLLAGLCVVGGAGRAEAGVPPPGECVRVVVEGLRVDAPLQVLVGRWLW